MKKIYLLLILLLLTSFQLAKQRESYYQGKFAVWIKGQKEVLLADKTRVDVLTDTFAIEVDFAEKWSESVGQSLYYSEKLNKKAGILLIINGKADDRYVQRLMTVAYKHNITVWIWDYNDDSVGKVDTDIRYYY